MARQVLVDHVLQGCDHTSKVGNKLPIVANAAASELLVWASQYFRLLWVWVDAILGDLVTKVNQLSAHEATFGGFELEAVFSESCEDLV